MRRSVTTGKELSRVPPSQLAPTVANNRLLAEVAGAVVVGQTVYILADAQVSAIPLTCGQRLCQPLWSAPAPQSAQRLIYARGHLFVDGKDGIYAYRAATGAAQFVLTQFSDQQELAGGVEYLEAADDLVFASNDDTIHAWKAAGCGAALCPPIWQANPSGVSGASQVFVEAGGKLFTPGGWAYALDSVQHSPYGPANAPRHPVVTNFQTASCQTSIVWTPPVVTGGLPLTASTVALSDGTVTQGASDRIDYFFLPAGSYIASIAEDSAWGPGASTTITFDVPSCH